MREADVVARIHQELKKQLPRCVYLKLNDLSTTGIPDLALTYGGRTTFVEVKFLKEDESPSSFKKHFSALQLATCQLLEHQGRCYYFISFESAEPHALIIKPHRLAYALEKGAQEVEDLYTLAVAIYRESEAINHLIWLVRQP
ncbi:MAG: hypothetical protein ACYDHE_19670 [Candidatus Acidiferrales bacterium]